MEHGTQLSESFKIFRLKTTSDDGYNPEIKMIPFGDEWLTFPTKEKAMSRIDDENSWDTFVILPVIQREPSW